MQQQPRVVLVRCKYSLHQELLLFQPEKQLLKPLLLEQGVEVVEQGLGLLIIKAQQVVLQRWQVGLKSLQQSPQMEGQAEI